jgi:hypothetical protein
MVSTPAARHSEDRSWPEDLNAAKTLFMTEVAHIVEDGRGELAMLGSGVIELRLAAGEIFHLGEHSVTRIV